jgi:hypothetical protein
MARLLAILLVGLLCEAIGVVFLSRGLKEIIWFLSAREIRDSAALRARLSNHKDPVSQYIWERLSPEQRARLTAGGPSDKAERAVLARAFNVFLSDGTLQQDERFANIRLSSEARLLLAQRPRGHELLHLNRLLLQDAFDGEVAKAESRVTSAADLLRLVGRGVANRHILLGVFLEALFFIALLMLMSKADVSFVWPLTSLSFVVTTIAAKLYLHEHVSGLRWAGVCLIMLGAGLISWTEKQAEAAATAATTAPSASQGALPQQ